MRQYIVKCKKCQLEYRKTSTHSFVCRACKKPDKVYSRTFYINKKIALDRDLKRCQCCGTHEGLATHHIDCNKQNNSISNLITLCQQCHISLHMRHTKEELRRSNIYNLFPDRFRWGKYGKRAIVSEAEETIKPDIELKKVKYFFKRKVRT